MLLFIPPLHYSSNLVICSSPVDVVGESDAVATCEAFMYSCNHRWLEVRHGDSVTLLLRYLLNI